MAANISEIITALRQRIERYTLTLQTLEELQANSGLGGGIESAVATRHEPAEPAARGKEKPPKVDRQPRIGKKAQSILDYVRLHPQSKTPAIAAALKFTRTCVGFHLTTLKRHGKLDLAGKGLWIVSKESSADSQDRHPRLGRPPLSPNKNISGGRLPELRFVCDICHAKFLTQKQLDDHDEVYHN